MFCRITVAKINKSIKELFCIWFWITFYSSEGLQTCIVTYVCLGYWNVCILSIWQKLVMNRIVSMRNFILNRYILYFFHHLLSFMLVGYLMHTPRCLKSQRCLQIKGNDWQFHSVAVFYFLKSELWKYDDLLIFINLESWNFLFECLPFLIYIMAYVAVLWESFHLYWFFLCT